MGIGPNGTNFKNVGGVSTPAVVSQNLKAAVPVQKTVAPLNTPGAGSNAQTQALAKSINKTTKTQHTFGMPGAK